jgi:CBS-domain-containing membrane protein
LPSSGTASSVGALGGPSGALPATQALESSDYHFKGIPIALIVVLLIVAAVAARYIRKFVVRVIGGAQ